MLQPATFFQDTVMKLIYLMFALTFSFAAPAHAHVDERMPFADQSSIEQPAMPCESDGTPSDMPLYSE